jgi:hypothetical protein
MQMTFKPQGIHHDISKRKPRSGGFAKIVTSPDYKFVLG